jgi:hypothetical protein
MLIVCCDSEWDNLTGMVMTREKKIMDNIVNFQRVVVSKICCGA